MKIALICDTHVGVKNDNPFMLDYMEKYFKEQFFPYLIDNNIQCVIHLGDLFDRRKYINYNTLSRVIDFFVSPLQKNAIEFHCISGNHDQYFRSSSDVNALKTLFDNRYNNFHVYWEPILLRFDSLKTLLIPWVLPGTSTIKSLLQGTKADVILTHLDINGFQVNDGHVCENGFDHNLFKTFKKVYSGHFHLKQSLDNIQYLGSPYQLQWSDFNQQKGFHVLDTNTLELKFIGNYKHIYHKIIYDNSLDINKDFSYIKDCFVKIIVRSRTDSVKFNKFIDNINMCNPADINILDELVFATSSTISEENISDTKDIINVAIDELDTSLDKKDIKLMMHDIYEEANYVEI